MTDLCQLRHVSKIFRQHSMRSSFFQLARDTVLGRQPICSDIHALREVSFSIGVGERIAVLGRNGSGKTTLFRIIAGIFRPTAGSVAVAVRPAVLMRLSLGFHEDMPVESNLRLIAAIYGLAAACSQRRWDRILAQSGLTQLRKAPVRILSIGQRQRLVVTLFFELDSPFLIFDESLANLDHEYLLTVDDYLRGVQKGDRSMLMASHDLGALQRYCTKAVWLEAGKIKQIGQIDEVVAGYRNTLGADTGESLLFEKHPSSVSHPQDKVA